MAALRKHVAVLYGGLSAEREVSLVSGAACATALEDQGYKVTLIDVDRTVSQRLADLRPDVAFNALHGNFGEDGIVQGIWRCWRSPTRIRASSPRRWPCRRTAPRTS